MPADEPSHIGRYTLHGAIARGGMATIHYGRFTNDVGFARTVAIKRLLPELAVDPGFVTMFVDEARLAARIQHPNVVQTLDVIREGSEVLLVLEYVHGASVGRIQRTLAERGERMPPAIAAAIVVGALHGVHAAHEARDERGELLELIHRDLSPDNILVDESGIARVADFGVAKARGRLQQATQPGGLKGKLRYMAPEQVHGNTSRRSDVFAMGVVLWEMLVGARLFDGSYDGEILAAVLTARVPRPSARRVKVPPALEDVLVKSLARMPVARHATALDMAIAIESSITVASASEVASWLHELLAETLEAQHREVAAIERAEGEPSARSGDAPEHRARTRDEESLVQRRRGLVSAALAGGVVLVLLVLAAMAGRDETPAQGAATTSSASPARTPSPSSLPVGSELPASEPPLDEATSQPTPAGSTNRPRTDRRPRRPRSTACDPPFTIDSQGVRTWKRQCF
ncbi:MAG: protein kinase [Labilithrix sp.]|nr:protein kinase [Labilithrix sp.]